MDKFFKVIAFLWFFISGYISIYSILGAAQKHELGIFMSYLVFQWLIALSLYFLGDFVRRVKKSEERMKRIIKKRKKFDERIENIIKRRGNV